MATAPDPDRVLGSTCGRDNFQRLSRLLISGGTTLLRETFDSKCPPTVLPGILNNPATKKQLKAAKLTKPQWDCLYPSPGTYGKSEDFDVTLLFRLLRTICSLTPPTTGWDVLPASTDHSLEADLARIKYYRNSVYGHVNQNMDIKVDDFLRLWQDIRQALVRIAKKIRPERETEWRLAIDNFLKDRLTAEDERNVQELQKWYKEDMDVKESIEKLVDTTQKINKSMEEVKEDVAFLRLRVDCVAIAQPDQREETPGMTGNENRPPPTTQDVLNLVSQKYLQKIDPSTPEEFNGFLDYLSNARQLLFVNAKRGSLIITVGCRSLQILDDLWTDYCTGRLNEMAQKYLVTKELLNELGLTEAKLTTSISEEEYRSCRNQLSVYAGLEQKIKLLKKGRDALQNQFFNWVWARGIIRFRALQIQSIANPRGTSESLVGIAALVGGTVAMLFTFGMSIVYGEAVVTSKVAAVAIGAAGAAVNERNLAALVGPRGSFIGLIGATVTAVAAVAAATAFGWKAALVGAAIVLSFIFGMSVGYGKASATGAVAAVAIGSAGAAVNEEAIAASCTFIALIGAAAAATAAFGWEAALVGAAITLLFTFGMSVGYDNAIATGAVEAVAAGAAGAAVNKGVFAPLVDPRGTFIGLILAAITTATAFGWKAALIGGAIALSFIFGMSVGYGNAIATGAVAAVAIGAAGATVNEGVFAALVGPRGIFIALVGAAATATAAFGWEATLVGAAITMLFTFGMSVVYGTASATGAVEAVAAGAVVGAIVGVVVGVVVVSFNKALRAIRVRNELLKLLLEEKMELLQLKSNAEPLKHCVADLAVYCREHTDQVLSSRLMAREFPFFCDILLKKEAKVRVIRLTLPALLEKELKVNFTCKSLINLPKRLGNGEDSGIINTKILLDELNEGPNDEEIRAMIVDFIEKEFAFFFLSSDQPGLGDPNKCYLIIITKNSNNA